MVRQKLKLDTRLKTVEEKYFKYVKNNMQPVHMTGLYPTQAMDWTGL